MNVYVTGLDDGTMECVVMGATGSPTTGRGHTVTEAVGDWAIQTGLVRLTCYPADLLEKYKLSFRAVGRRS